MLQEEKKEIDSKHVGLIHDAQLDHYSRRLATASSDTKVNIFNVDNAQGEHQLVESLAHDSAVWRVSWAHPKFGTLLATCQYNGTVRIFEEVAGSWSPIYEHKHQASVNSIAWAPHELGAILACASTDGTISTLERKDDGTWEVGKSEVSGAGSGYNAVAWAPAVPGETGKYVKRLVTGDCDNLIKIWIWSDDKKEWELEAAPHDGHNDWVRDVAWEPCTGLSRSRFASCAQDKTVLIWTQEQPGAPWVKKSLGDHFADALWRVSWSLSGSVLAVTCADNKVTLWKETSNEWKCIKEVAGSA